MKASKIVDEIIDDLSGRCGIGDEWQQIDHDVQREIRGKWIQIVRKTSGTAGEQGGQNETTE